MTTDTEALPPLPEPIGYANPASIRMMHAGYQERVVIVRQQDALLSDYGHQEPDVPVFTAEQVREAQRAALAQRQQVPDANEWRSLLIGGFVQKWSGNDQVKAGDVLDWIMDQPIAAAPALTAAPSAQAEPQEPLPFNSAQRRRLWDNSPEIRADAKSYAAFERIVQLVESARGIGKQESK